eukprot:2680490-Alexandrium_andersonii.AAC.1
MRRGCCSSKASVVATALRKRFCPEAILRAAQVEFFAGHRACSRAAAAAGKAAAAFEILDDEKFMDMCSAEGLRRVGKRSSPSCK